MSFDPITASLTEQYLAKSKIKGMHYKYMQSLILRLK